MKKIIFTVAKIGGVALIVTGIAVAIKLVTSTLINKEKMVWDGENENKVSDFDESFETHEYDEEKGIDLDEERNIVASDISERHQAAAKFIKEMLDDMDENKRKEDGLNSNNVDTEDRVNFDEIDSCLDKLLGEV